MSNPWRKDPSKPHGNSKYTKAIVQGWQDKMRAKKLNASKLARIEGVPVDTVYKKIEQLDAGELVN